ncbi:hypothetical protein PR202_ga04028 [Eleusine coracana subsp. coracana]|uniref:F-box domain-containing protein n=1 Tax=Eleusine coracana subsp. coracana TaxID=191504 RepID=A0AAV5BQX8_ELECO|nr:hypothetical protein PR202_ga04028 [Eleusine coracana subsp. coracana]
MDQPPTSDAADWSKLPADVLTTVLCCLEFPDVFSSTAGPVVSLPGQGVGPGWRHAKAPREHGCREMDFILVSTRPDSRGTCGCTARPEKWLPRCKARKRGKARVTARLFAPSRGILRALYLTASRPPASLPPFSPTRGVAVSPLDLLPHSLSVSISDRRKVWTRFGGAFGLIWTWVRVGLKLKASVLCNAPILDSVVTKTDPFPLVLSYVM